MGARVDGPGFTARFLSGRRPLVRRIGRGQASKPIGERHLPVVRIDGQHGMSTNGSGGVPSSKVPNVVRITSAFDDTTEEGANVDRLRLLLEEGEDRSQEEPIGRLRLRPSTCGLELENPQAFRSAVVRSTTRLHPFHPKIFQIKLLLEKRDLRVSLFKRGPATAPRCLASWREHEQPSEPPARGR